MKKKQKYSVIKIKKISQVMTYLLAGVAAPLFPAFAETDIAAATNSNQLPNINIQSNFNSGYSKDSINSKANNEESFTLLNNADIRFSVPLDDKEQTLLLFQGGLTHDGANSATTINAGLVARISSDETMAFGLNAFFDYYAGEGNHHRLGLGAEALFDYGKFYTNYYLPINDWSENKRELKNNAGEVKTKLYQAQAARGFDIGFQGQLPLHPQVGAKVSYEKYFGEKVALHSNSNPDEWQKDPTRLTIGINYSPVAAMQIGGEYRAHWNDNNPQSGASQANKNSNKDGFYANLSLTYRFGVDPATQFSFDGVADIRKLGINRYDFVERNNQIVLTFKEKLLDQPSGSADSSQPVAKISPENLKLQESYQALKDVINVVGKEQLKTAAQQASIDESQWTALITALEDPNNKNLFLAANKTLFQNLTTYASSVTSGRNTVTTEPEKKNHVLMNRFINTLKPFISDKVAKLNSDIQNLGINIPQQDAQDFESAVNQLESSWNESTIKVAADTELSILKTAYTIATELKPLLAKIAQKETLNEIVTASKNAKSANEKILQDGSLKELSAPQKIELIQQLIDKEESEQAAQVTQYSNAYQMLKKPSDTFDAALITAADIISVATADTTPAQNQKVSQARSRLFQKNIEKNLSIKLVKPQSGASLTPEEVAHNAKLSRVKRNIAEAIAQEDPEKQSLNISEDEDKALYDKHHVKAWAKELKGEEKNTYEKEVSWVRAAFLGGEDTQNKEISAALAMIAPGPFTGFESLKAAGKSKFEKINGTSATLENDEDKIKLAAIAETKIDDISSHMQNAKSSVKAVYRSESNLLATNRTNAVDNEPLSVENILEIAQLATVKKETIKNKLIAQINNKIQ